MGPLTFFNSPPISPAGLRRLQQAAANSPPFQMGEGHSDGVKALQQGLIALYDSQISIPSGPTGNYLHETQAAVRAFQAKFGLRIDGVAGRQTIERLDRELDSRSRRVLDRLDRCIDGCKRPWTQDAYRMGILRQMEADLRNLRASNVLGFAAAAVVLVLLVILLFAVMMFYAMPQSQRAIRRLMSEVIDAVRARGEVAQQKIEELNAQIRTFIASLTDLRTECEKNKEATEPDKFRDCKRIHRLTVQAAFEALIRTMKSAAEVIIIGIHGERMGPRGRNLERDAFVEVGQAFVKYLTALNDFMKCLGCPEFPFPLFPDFPDFP